MLRVKKHQEGRKIKMKNDSKSGLCIQQIIIIAIMLLIASFSIGLVSLKNIFQVVRVGEQDQVIQENTQEVIQIAQTSEREVLATTRASEERTIATPQQEALENEGQELETLTQEFKQEETIIEEELEENKQNYISIEEITISREMDLTKSCGVSKEDFKILMENLRPDTSGFFETNSELIYDLCAQYELNEIFFCGLIAGESGWKISSNHRNTNNYISMMSGGKLIHYSSVEEGLEAAAKLLHNKYLTEGGSCYYRKNTFMCSKKILPKLFNMGRTNIWVYESNC